MNINIKNCNNIKNASITIEKNSLNIKYGMNGTGKSTIAKAIANRDQLSELKTFGSNLEPEISVSENINKVEIFNNDFINRITFNGSEVIDNGFEIFVKTEEYDSKRKEITNILNKLNRETFNDQIINKFREGLLNIATKIQLNSNNTVKRTSTYKSILKKENMFEVPQELTKYSEFIQDKSMNINWVDWKNKGFEFDEKNKCPFCAEKLSEKYSKEKETFKENYTKSGMKNLNDILETINDIKDYLNKEKYNKLIECIKENKNEEDIDFIYQKFILEITYLNGKFEKIYQFDSYNIKNSEIGKLGDKVKELIINKEELNYFYSENVFEIIDNINKKINEIVNKITDLQAKTATLNTFIKNSINSSKEDINRFLETAGFNYKFDFIVSSENVSKTILIYKGEEDINVDNIDKHLSWGEKNAFALVLFMYYAISKKAELIILDDPISSFDSNKKYAIINRLFENRNDRKSFYGKTVLMLTHDFEPIIDFIINNKPNSGHAIAKYIKNTNNIVIEQEINKKDDIISIVELAYKYVKDNNLNMISRINFLRKYIEHTKVENFEEKQLMYDMLSSVVHAKEYPDKQVERDTYLKFTEEEFEKAQNIIKNYIENFDYDRIVKNYYNKEYILKEFFEESNNYIKSQLFREYLEVSEERKNLDNNLLKFIDEIYHIENDYIFTIDLIKFDTIPDYIIEKINDFMEEKAQ
jgi:ABC-type Mn2+/Zn2+ transport system ATPase subunit